MMTTRETEAMEDLKTEVRSLEHLADQLNKQRTSYFEELWQLRQDNKTLRDMLDDLIEELDERADCETIEGRQIPNRDMKLMMIAKEALAKCKPMKDKGAK